MSDPARRLLGRIIADRDMAEPLRRGVSQTMFHDPKLRDVFKFLAKGWAEYSEVPTYTSVLTEFPGMSLQAPDDCLDFLIDAFLGKHRHSVLMRTIDSVVGVLERNGSTDDALQALRAGVVSIDQLSSGTINDHNLMEDPELRYAEYRSLVGRAGGLLGLPTGFPTMDLATAGLQPGQLVTIIASPKTGKSQLALKVASNMQRQGHPIVFQSFEMSNDEQKQRYDSLRFGLSHSRLRTGSLVESEEASYKKGLEGSKGDVPIILLDSATGITVSALSAKVQQYRPAAVFVDGVYLMIDEVTGEQNSPQALTNITRSLKRMAQRLSIPVVISTQTLTWKMAKTKVTANSIGYSSSFYQDSDVIFGLERIEGDEEAPMRRLKIVASRNSPNAETDLTWDWDRGRFEEVGAVQSAYEGGEDIDKYVYRRKDL